MNIPGIEPALIEEMETVVLPGLLQKSKEAIANAPPGSPPLWITMNVSPLMAEAIVAYCTVLKDDHRRAMELIAKTIPSIRLAQEHRNRLARSLTKLMGRVIDNEGGVSPDADIDLSEAREAIEEALHV